MSDIALRFGATDDGLTAQFRRVNREMDAFERAATRVGTQTQKAFSAISDELGRFAKIGAAVFAVKEIVEFADSLQKTADQTGIAIESLQRLSFVALQTSGDLSSISTAVGRLQRSLVLAGEGSREAASSLARLGIPLAEFRGLSPDLQFERVARAIAQIEDPAERATAAIGLFGRSGADLLPVLLRTGEGLAEIDAKFAAIGGAVAESAIQKVDDLGDAFGTTVLAAKSLGTELVGLFAPAVIAGLEELSGAIGSVRLLLGGGTEIDQLQRKIEILKEAKDGIPVFFDFGYTEDGARVLAGPEEIQRQIDLLDTRLRDLRDQPAVGDATSRGPGTRKGLLRDLGDVGGAPKTGGSGAARSPVAQASQELTPDERRIAADARTPAGLDFSQDSVNLAEITNQEVIDGLLAQWDGYADLRIEQESALGSALSDLRRQYGVEEINFEELKSASIQDINASLASSLLTIAASAFGQNKKVALAVAGINIAVGMSKALELPFPANLAAVAKVAAQGAQILGSIRSASIGGGAGIGGSVGAAGVSQTTGADNRPAAEGVAERSATNIYITGYIGDRQVKEMIDRLRGELDRDVVLIPANSRQAIELRGA